MRLDALMVVDTIDAFISNRVQSVALAFTIIPSPDAWLRSLGILFLLLIAAIPIAFRSGFLRFERMKGSGWRLAGVALILLIRPCLIEELFFRVLLLPHPSQGVALQKVLGWAAVSLAAFVLWHPINGLVFRKSARSLFSNRDFLLLAGLVGVATTAAYLTSGSIWPPILIHWVMVLPWILLLGGKNALLGRTLS